MLLLCFILDLRTLAPSQLTELKQSLLQLSNLYAIAASGRQSDRIGLCYLHKNRVSGVDEVRIAYSPTSTNFNLRGFHRAVNDLPTDGFLPEALENHSASFCCQDMRFSSVLRDGVLYTWGGNDIIKKVIVISSCLPHNLDTSSEKTIMDAAENCISIEFVFLEPRHSHLCDLSASSNTFIQQITRLDNCSFQTYIPDVTDVQVLCGLVKRWLQDLKDGIGEPLHACFTFQGNHAGSMNKMFCNLVASFLEHVTFGRQLIDAFSVKKVGEQTIPCLSSFWSCMNLQQVSLPIDFNIIQRTNLGTLSEGALIGTAYIVAPTMCHEMEASSDGIAKTELNTSFFQGLCSALNKLDQGMICYSNCNISTLRETDLRCYYVLQPSDKGLMLLRRLAGLEEILPVPEVNHLVAYSVTKEIEDCIEALLLKINLADYNPILLERGFHQKLNLLINESLQFCTVSHESEEIESKQILIEHHTSEAGMQSNSDTDDLIMEEGEIHVAAREDGTSACATDDWELLVVDQVPKDCHPSKDIGEEGALWRSDKQLDGKTSRILERLEVPKQLKSKASSPINQSSHLGTTKAMIQFQPAQLMEQGSSLKQPMKPYFQRHKRKMRR
ncbi:hypothetical protein RJ641_004493 [Dillenia turbinata]|uniref:Uncharacterized protein n=1 Tax=Dillenia turbinata TaxID=194707 RepID=A0AAN8VBJ8_9MAGN